MHAFYESAQLMQNVTAPPKRIRCHVPAFLDGPVADCL
ncbi:Uncharacterized protein PPKH_2755 [Pseudomonas putida]|nr:Uncharacterized protein PPKH_2755 [Pseudomonas putida]